MSDRPNLKPRVYAVFNRSAIEESAKEYDVPLKFIGINSCQGEDGWYTILSYNLHGRNGSFNKTEGSGPQSLFSSLIDILKAEDEKIFQGEGSYILPEIILPLQYDARQIYSLIASHNEKLQLYEECGQ